ncbi:hypothetical protein CR513_00625, partial [Mucuna pruriens]
MANSTREGSKMPLTKSIQDKTGDMVLKKVLPNAHDPRGKWAPNYEGPYVVKHTFSGGACS